jgi:hypothetical protein
VEIIRPTIPCGNHHQFPAIFHKLFPANFSRFPNAFPHLSTKNPPTASPAEKYTILFFSFPQNDKTTLPAKNERITSL